MGHLLMSSTFSPFLALLLMDGLSRRAHLSFEARGSPAPFRHCFDRHPAWAASLANDYATSMAAQPDSWDVALARFFSAENTCVRTNGSQQKR